MVIADRLRAIREQKNMSQGDIEKRTGLLRCYISRVENGHTVPAIETLEQMARAMEVPTSFSTMARNRPNQISQSLGWRWAGAVPVEMRGHSTGFAAS
jgi:transcriptional regulator with XRE-family HTH domain